MKMSLKLRDDIVALMEEYVRQEGAKGISISDSKVGREAVGYADFIRTLREWDGGRPAPGMALVAKFEAYLADQVGKDSYEAFIQRRAAMIAGDSGF